MGLKSDIISLIADTVPGCVAEHDRDSIEKLHSGDLQALADEIARYVRARYRKRAKR